MVTRIVPVFSRILVSNVHVLLSAWGTERRKIEEYRKIVSHQIIRNSNLFPVYDDYDGCDDDGNVIEEVLSEWTKETFSHQSELRTNEHWERNDGDDVDDDEHDDIIMMMISSLNDDDDDDGGIFLYWDYDDGTKTTSLGQITIVIVILIPIANLLSP